MQQKRTTKHQLFMCILPVWISYSIIALRSLNLRNATAFIITQKAHMLYFNKFVVTLNQITALKHTNDHNELKEHRIDLLKDPNYGVISSK